jgi:hypothetical protein
MLENLSIRPVLDVDPPIPGRLEVSDNPGGAENQQERLVRLGWVIGFVGGEGCFSVGFARQPDRVSRKGYRTGYQVSHSFAVTQGKKNVSCLHELKEFFGVGGVTVNRRHDNHKEHLYRYTVSGRADLVDVIVPFFQRNPLRSTKRSDFDAFVSCLGIVKTGRHLQPDGLIEIAQIAETMNRQKPRTELIRILRGHTPDTLDKG